MSANLPATHPPTDWKYLIALLLAICEADYELPSVPATACLTVRFSYSLIRFFLFWQYNPPRAPFFLF